MMFWMLSGVLVLHLSDGSLDYRTVKLNTYHNTKQTHTTKNKNPNTHITNKLIITDNTYIIKTTHIAPPELGEADH